MQNSQEANSTRNHAGLEQESWESLAQMTLKFNTEIINNNGGRKISKKMQYLKHLIHLYLKDSQGIEVFSSSRVLVKFARTVHGIENYLVKNNIPSTPFLIFLKAIVEKAKKEKIRAQKPFERLQEFGKLKEHIGFENTLSK